VRASIDVENSGKVGLLEFSGQRNVKRDDVEKVQEYTKHSNVFVDELRIRM